jgi:hypothetical protein
MEIFSKDFMKKDHDNRQGVTEVRGTDELQDGLNIEIMGQQIFFGARILSSLMRMALGHA